MIMERLYDEELDRKFNSTYNNLLDEDPEEFKISNLKFLSEESWLSISELSQKTANEIRVIINTL